MRKKIQIIHQGQTGNKIIQLLVAKSLQNLVPDSEILGLNIPEIGLTDDRTFSGNNISLFDAGHDFSLRKLAYYLNTQAIDVLGLRIFGARLEHFPDLNASRLEFGSFLDVRPNERVASDEVLIHIRANDVVVNPHSDYPLLPLNFYQEVCDMHNLRPVFMGQIANDLYGSTLRARFGGARIIPMSSVVEDLRLIASAENIVCSVSSFAWIAAWLSRRAQQVHMPLAGLFNPLQRPDIDLIPCDDARFHFYYFEPQEWTASSEQIAACISSAQPAKRIEAAQLQSTLLKIAQIKPI
jgi:hypothetical protein